jgi:sugar lactone lactonase YvrE
VRKVSPGGTITTINRQFDDSCGPPPFTPCGTDGGPASAARLLTPTGVAVDRRGNVYIVETDGHRVRKVSSNGTITTIAGMEGKFGYSGDGGPATSARLKQPHGVAVDRTGNVYIADTVNNRVRKVSSGGKITTFAGTGKPGFSGDGGPSGRARLHGPQDVAVDARGNVYILDFHNNRVRKVSSRGTITTVAGSGASGDSGDGGPATRASFVYPLGLAVDGKGNVYISDYGSNRVRKVRP